MGAQATGSPVRLHVENGIATITIDRPKALNALNSEVLAKVHAAVEDVKGRASGILVTGAGDRAFVAGADIAEMADYGPDEATAFSRKGQAAFQALEDFPGLTVAAVNGYALGGGLELALACDVLIASTGAKLGLPEATLGVVPGFGGTQRLPRRVGPGWAKRMLLTGKPVDAETALRIGLADQLAAPEDLLATATKLLLDAAHVGPVAAREAKRLVREGLDMPQREAIAAEADAFGGVFATADQKEGMRAFLEKRKPAFRGI